MRSLPVALLALLLLMPVQVAQATPETLQLLGRSSAQDYHLVLDDSDRGWLRSKGTLLLGASSPEYPPFGITNNGSDYEGLTADYAQLLAELLQVEVKVLRYNSRQEVIAALKQGQVDFLGTANGYEVADPQLVLSSPYADDQPTLVSRSEDVQAVSADLADKRLAMVYYYLPPEQVRAFYPKARLQLYPSTLSAIGAVAFGQADVYLGDAIGAHYLIRKNYLNNVQLAEFSRMEVSDFAFAVARDNPRLLRILNAALAVIPSDERLSILRRWNSGGASLSGKSRVNFTAAEQRWLDHHPRVRVAIDGSFVPLSFFSRDGEFRGVAADILDKITLRSGLQFDVEQSFSVPDLIERIKTGKADVLVSLSPSREREDVLSFTRPYLNTPYVMISATREGAPQTLDEMSGRRLVLTRGSPIQDLLAERYPEVQVLTADNAQQALERLARGEADAAVSSLIVARYMVSRHFAGQLQITSTVGTSAAHVAFATARGATELHGILDKTMLSIPPEELDELTNRWRSPVVLDDSYWSKHRAAILQGFALAYFAQGLEQWPAGNNSLFQGDNAFSILLMWAYARVSLEPLLQHWLDSDSDASTLNFVDACYWDYVWNANQMGNAFAADQAEYKRTMEEWLNRPATKARWTEKLMRLVDAGPTSTWLPAGALDHQRYPLPERISTVFDAMAA